MQLGKGKVVVQRFDPNADAAVKSRADRVGVKPLQLSSSSTTSLSVDVHWQGLRLLYGGDKQKVIPQFLPQVSFYAEAVLTPAIKELTTTQKRKFGLMEWPVTAVGQQQPGGIGWNFLRTLEGIARRYEFQNYREDGALLPDDLDTLFLFRPKELTDRQKYMLDQFVVRGGTLVVFADASRYHDRPAAGVHAHPVAARRRRQQATAARPVVALWHRLEAEGRRRHGGAGAAGARARPLLAVGQMDNFGRQTMAPVAYPYFFHTLPFDWKNFAADLAKDGQRQGRRSGGVQLPPALRPGHAERRVPVRRLQAERPWPRLLLADLGRSAREGGRRRRPATERHRARAPLVEPGGAGRGSAAAAEPVRQRPRRDPAQHQYLKFRTKLTERLRSEPRLQVPLMVEVAGRFTSVFAGQERPKRPSEIKEEEARKAAPTAKVDDPATPQDESKPTDSGPPAQSAKPDGKGADQQAQAAEPPMRTDGDKPGRILVVGDADFLRDDIARGDFAQAGGPVSGRMAAPFFAQMLDWLAEDDDLVALQSKTANDRTLKFVDGDSVTGADPRQAEVALRNKVRVLRWTNIVLPGGLLALLGCVVLTVPHAQKRSFLASLR